MTTYNPKFDHLENIAEEAAQELKSHFLTIAYGNNVASERYQKLVKNSVTGFQELEDAVYNSMFLLSLNGATGEALNVIGGRIGESRYSITGVAASDSQYRINIAYRKRLNLACGTWEDFITACEYLQVNQLITGYHISERAMVMHIMLYGVPATISDYTKIAIKELFKLVKCAEVTLDITFVIGSLVFGWDNDPDTNTAGFDIGGFTGII